jgi:hypothetical protein
MAPPVKPVNPGPSTYRNRIRSWGFERLLDGGVEPVLVVGARHVAGCRESDHVVGKAGDPVDHG